MLIDIEQLENLRVNQARRANLAPKLVALRGGDDQSPKRLSYQGEKVDGPVKVYLYDVIGWPFIEAQDLVQAVPEDASEIELYINSPGGDVFEGMAIYNFFQQHKAEVRVLVNGLAASSASLVASAGNKVEMSPASFLMIHNAWTIMAGNADELRKEADLLDKIGQVFAEIYSKRTGKEPKELLNLMKNESWFTPQQAIDAGFADGITGRNADPQAGFNLAIFNKFFDKGAQGLQGHNGQKQKEDNDMNEKLRQMLIKKGLDPQATDEQALEFLAKLEQGKDLSDQEREEIDAHKQSPQAGFTQEDLDKAIKQAAKNERQRQQSIRQNCQLAGLDETFAGSLIDEDITVDQAREKIFAEMQKVNPPIGAGRIQVGEHDQDKFRNAVADGMCMRAGMKIKDPAPGAKDFLAVPLYEMAKICLDRAGVDTRQLHSPKQKATAILKHSRRAELSTDDFSSILQDVQNKRLLSAYREAKRTFLPLITTVSASDFKTQYGVALSEASDLDPLTEHENYKEASFKDKQESYAVKKYGKVVYLSMEMIVNDDQRAFARVPQLFGAAAARKESDIIWALITGNPTMNEDSKTLFHSDHSNLEGTAAYKGTVSPDRISRGRQAMRIQTGMKGAILDLTPTYLLLPTAQETDGEILVRSTTLPKENMPAGSYNYAQSLIPISDPRLDNVSTKSWYMAADPSQIDLIEMAFLDGEQEPYTEEETIFERDAMGYKIRHIFGAGIMDYRGLWKNPGE